MDCGRAGGRASHQRRGERTPCEFLISFTAELVRLLVCSFELFISSLALALTHSSAISYSLIPSFYRRINAAAAAAAAGLRTKRKENENKRTKAGLNHHPASQPCDFDYA